MHVRPSHYRRSVKRDLTPRQREVLALIAKGYTNGEIAEALGITLDGAKFHVTEILDRLEAPNREAAAELWRRERSPVARLLGAIALPLGVRVAIGGAAVAGLAAAGVAAVVLLGSSGETADAGPSLDEIVAAIRRPGEAFHAELEAKADDGSTGTYNVWYSSDDSATRTESVSPGQPQPQVTIISDDREASYDPQSNMFHESPQPSRANGMPDGAIAYVPAIAIFVSADGYSFEGEETVDGERVYRFDSFDVRTADEAHEQVPGTTIRYTIYLGVDDLLPRDIRGTIELPGEEAQPLPFPTFRTVEFVPRAALPADFFDRAALASKKVTIEQSLDIARQQSYATFWLGPRLDIPWAMPNGEHWDHQEVVLVSAPGIPGTPLGQNNVVLGYGPPGGYQLTLVDMQQRPVSSFDPIPKLLFDAMDAAGNVKGLASGDGYFYVQYFTRAQCSQSQAQSDPECRMAAATYGAVIEREGTRVHIASAPKLDGASDAAKDTNPFSSEAAILELVSRLQRLP